MGIMRLRPKDGDKRWIDPDLNMVYAFPRIMSTVMHGLPQTEEAAAFAGKLSVLFSDCKECKINLEELKAAIAKLCQEHQTLVFSMSFDLFLVLMGEFRTWCIYVMPKTKDDQELDLFDLDKAAEIMMQKKSWWSRLAFWRK